MSSTRRTAAPRKRAKLANAQPLPVREPATGDEASVECEAGNSDPHDVAHGLLSNLDEALRDAPGIDQEDREAFIELFAASLREVVDSGAHAYAPSESEWQASIDALKRHSADAGANNNDLARQLVGAVAALEQRQTKITLEFSRRVQAHGQESALAWLKEQNESSAESDEPSPEPPNASPLSALRGEVTKSKSRRLRGPPK